MPEIRISQKTLYLIGGCAVFILIVGFAVVWKMYSLKNTMVPVNDLIQRAEKPVPELAKIPQVERKAASPQHQEIEMLLHVGDRAGKEKYATILNKAWEQIGTDNFDDAIATLEGAKPFGPPEFSYLYYFLLAKAHFRLVEKMTKGSKTAQEMQALVRNSEHGRLTIVSLKQAQRLNPTFAPTMESLWTYHQVAEQWDEALLAADSLVKLMPEYARGYTDRAICFSSLKKPELALADFKISLELNPHDPQVHFLIGHVWSDLKEYDKAIKSYNTALSLKYLPSLCHFSIGNAYKKAGNYHLAIQAFEQARFLGWPEDLCNEQIAVCRKLAP